MSNSSINISVPLNGKVALVTGAASGIGAAIATMLAHNGATVAIVDVNLNAATASAATIGHGSVPFACDVSNFDSVTEAVNAVTSQLGAIDILINSAGIVALDPAEVISQDAWNRTINVNLTGTFNMCQAVGTAMIANAGGKIVNLASQAGTVAIDQHVAYCASKFGVIGLTKVLALEWGGKGITVNSISPTIVLTELGKQAWAGEKGNRAKELIPVGRFAQPEEIAAAALFLVSNGADMINGADLIIDGGYTIH
ncbi:MAG: D-threitol dehydrogenase [Candidatus Nanopelagicales bacterium]|nr:D-threitol dehydrogenase [Candidatus Nanopelagicales bacterium]